MSIRKLHIIMPMAGEGSRFLNAGIKVPKPMLIHANKYLFNRAIDSLSDINCEKTYTFIVRTEHVMNNGIDIEIKKIFPNSNIVAIDETTRGSVETCLAAKSFISDNDAFIILDCDLEFKSKSFDSFIMNNLQLDNNENCIGGGVVSFESNDNRFSYALVDKYNQVVKTAEKKVISKNALIGAYYFSRGDLFLNVAEKVVNSNQQEYPEFYTSILYNYLINDGFKIYLNKSDEYFSYGTPEELLMHER